MPLRVSGNPTNVTDAGRSRTGTHLSTNIYIAVNRGSGPEIVGAVKTLQVTETRNISKIAEVGTDGIIDSAPSKSTEISGSCERTRFDGVRIAQAFRRGFVHVHAQREPFDIQIYDIIKGDAENIIITEIKNVWIKSISYTYSSEDFVIVDRMDWEAETILSQRGHSNAGFAVPASSQLAINQFEREADRGDFRGALDAANLIGAFDGSGV